MRLALLAVLSVCLVSPAQARPHDPYADFSGVYLGVQTDYASGGGGDWCSCTPAPFVADAGGGDGGLIVGGHFGYDRRWGPLVVEAETRLSYADVSFAETCGAFDCAGEAQWLAEAHFGAGLVIGNTLIAAQAGIAAGDVEAQSSAFTPATAPATAIHNGIVMGARIEYAMIDGWRMALEYRHYDMKGENDIAGGAPVEIEWTSHVGGVRMTVELPE